MTELMDLLAAQRDPAERIGVFAESLHAEESPALRELERTALENGIPIIRPHTRGLIQCILEMKAPQRILEIGTAVGYSALVMYTYAPAPCEIVTIERDEQRAAQARQNFAQFGAKRITLLEGDAAAVLPQLDGTFDLIFMDAAKGQYIRFLPEVIRLLREGGVLLSDNVLKEGEILESKFAVTRRNRTIHKRMREYLAAVSEDPRLRTILLETGDGATLSVRRRCAEDNTETGDLRQ
jgi:predicted O-methyltransferase YrrM